jgi:DNA-3-methyladenine glycosylase
MILPKKFYNRPTLQIAQDLLGCFLVRNFKNPLSRSAAGVGEGRGVREMARAFKIVETESYIGPKDLASHANRGRTERNGVMFGEPGIIYVYFTYGMHYMLNIVTEKKDYPAAVLIRAVEPVNGRNTKSCVPTNGPARLTKALKIDKSFNNLPIYTKKYGLWIESREEEIKPNQIVKTTRIGVDYGGKYKDKKWRFYIKGNGFVSKK